MQYSNSYTDIHEWLGKTYGKANHCEFCEKKDAKKYEYALKKGRDHCKDINCYIQLCTSCHRRYDWNDKKSLQCSIRNRGKNNPNYGIKASKEKLEKMSKALKGRTFSKETIEKFRQGQLRRWSRIKNKCE